MSHLRSNFFFCLSNYTLVWWGAFKDQDDKRRLTIKLVMSVLFFVLSLNACWSAPSVCPSEANKRKRARENRRRQSSNSLSQSEDIVEQCELRKEFPLSKFKWLQMCAWLCATVHIWTAELPHVPAVSIALRVSSHWHEPTLHPGKAIRWKTWPLQTAGSPAAVDLLQEAWKVH